MAKQIISKKINKNKNKQKTSVAGKFNSGQIRICGCVTTEGFQSMSLAQQVFTIYCCGSPGACGQVCPCYTKSMYVVAQDELAVVESFGKFLRVVHPGPMLLNK
jgi:hypothetical protein